MLQLWLFARLRPATLEFPEKRRTVGVLAKFNKCQSPWQAKLHISEACQLYRRSYPVKPRSHWNVDKLARRTKYTPHHTTPHTNIKLLVCIYLFFQKIKTKCVIYKELVFYMKKMGACLCTAIQMIAIIWGCCGYLWLLMCSESFFKALLCRC